jgi:phasin family protein
LARIKANRQKDRRMAAKKSPSQTVKSAAPAAGAVTPEAPEIAVEAAADPLPMAEPLAAPASEPAVLEQAAPVAAPLVETPEPTQPEPKQPEPKQKEMLIMDKAIKSTEELVTFGQGNVEALIKSSQIWAAGVQDLGKHLAATAQASMDETMATVKALSGVKSVKEAMDLQSSFTKTSIEKLVAETGKLTDASMKLAEQAMAPITERVTIATEKFARPAV